MKKHIEIFCKVVAGFVIAVIIFIAGGFWESLKHPEIVKEQSITIRELKAELVKRQPFSLQTGDDFDLSFTPDPGHAACVGFTRRPLSKFQKDYIKAKTNAVESANLTIAGAGSEGTVKVWSQTRWGEEGKQ